MNRTILSLGSNAISNWGTPGVTLARAAAELQQRVGPVLHASNTYMTEPVGPVRQGMFLNQIIVLETRLPAAMMLRVLKTMERQAGRRTGTSVRWGPRALDIDIIDHGGCTTGRHHRMRGRSILPVQAPLVLPHPQAHARAFVQVPLLHVLPHWWHPGFRQSGRRLLVRLGRRNGITPA